MIKVLLFLGAVAKFDYKSQVRDNHDNYLTDIVYLKII